MDSRKVILLVGALIVAAVTAFFARTLVMGSSAPTAAAAPPVPQGPQVLVATHALPVGTILDPTAMKFQPWPKELVDNAYYLQGAADPKALQGTVVRTAITAGQPITQGSLVKPGDRGFLAAALGPGMRAVTFPVSAQSAVAGFVFPGDRIDLVLTQSVAGGGDGPPLKTSETIVRNLRVLATDQRTDNLTDENGKTVVRTFGTVTVEATPRIAEDLAVAQTLGSLSLSLRSLADNSTELEQAIASGQVKVPDGANPQEEKAFMLQMATQPQAGQATFATSGDVSRFQRKTVPGKAGDTIGMTQAPRIAAAAPPMAAAATAYPGAVAAPRGPVIHIARGNSVTDVSVGGTN